MKKPGLIGGLGPESTIQYYRLLINEYQERLDTKDYPEVFINSLNMTSLLQHVADRTIDNLVDLLVSGAKALKKAGADFGAIASNTPHIVYDQVVSRVDLPFICIVEKTCQAIQLKGLHNIGLIGTKLIMSNPYYGRKAEDFGIKIVSPTSSEQDYIHGKYMSEIVFNDIQPETKNRLIQIVKEMVVIDSIEGLILGGTELPLMLSQSDFPDLAIFDTSKIHVSSIVDMMLEE